MDITALNNGEITFEDFKNQNGITFWWASEFMVMLGYDSMASFRKAIDKATKAFISLGIDQYDNIIRVDREMDGRTVQDFKLTRFACYMIAMNADPRKQQVASAQVYFAEQTRQFELSVQKGNDIDRVIIREEMKEGNKSLQHTAYLAGVDDYPRFMNAGWKGMYHAFNTTIAQRRGCKKDKIYEGMGRTELAANLFRVTQTEERIKSRSVSGQSALEKTHYDVGNEVRKMVIRNTGRAPEELPQERPVPEIKKQLKSDFRKMKQIDKKNK